MTNYTRFTLSQIRYLIGLYRLSADGCGVKNTELARTLGLSKPSVHYMLKSLSALGMVTQKTFGLAHLTEDGYRTARKYAVCFALLERKMAELCGNDAVSENAICGMLADMPPENIDHLYDLESKQCGARCTFQFCLSVVLLVLHLHKRLSRQIFLKKTSALSSRAQIWHTVRT